MPIVFTDSHCHLGETPLFAQWDHIQSACKRVGVRRFIVPATCAQNFDAISALADHAAIRPAFGIHPWFTDTATDTALAALEAALIRHPHALVGEIGLDFYDPASTPHDRACQETVFLRQLELAQRYRRPIILHQRKSLWRCRELIHACRFHHGGLAHAFSGSLNEAEDWCAHGFKIGLGLPLLNPNARRLHRIATHLPLSGIVLETDAPFMAAQAQALGATTNTPALIPQIAQALAQWRGIALAEVSAQTEANIDSLLTTLPAI